MRTLTLLAVAILCLFLGAGQGALAASAEAQNLAIAAANHYGVDVRLVRAVMAQENCPESKRNTNDTIDMGPMCINSVHLTTLAKYRITALQLMKDQRLNIFIGTWLLRMEFQRTKGDLWRAIGNYHSRTPDKNADYQQRIWRRYLVEMRRDPRPGDEQLLKRYL